MTNIEEEMQKRGVIVYGGGRIGKQMIKKLLENHISVINVWDQNAKNIKNVDKITVPNYQYADKKTFIIICIFSKKVCREIEEELRKNGFQNIFNNRSKELKFIYCDYGKKEFDIKICNKCMLTTEKKCNFYIEELKGEKEQYIDIDLLAVVPTAKCTLKCLNCIQFTGEYRRRKIDIDYEYDLFKDIWQKVEKIFGWITQVRFTGGELFLHKDWKRIVEVCLNSESVGIVSIITNGIHKFSEEDCKFLLNPKIVVLLDDYSSKLGFKQRELFKETKNKFFRFGVNFVVLDNTEGTWYQCGKFKKNNLDCMNIKKLYQNCVFNECFSLSADYSFSMCGRANVAKDLGYIDTTKEDCVDLMYCSDIELIRKRIKNLLEKDYLEICQYCMGSNIIVPAGEQREE